MENKKLQHTIKSFVLRQGHLSTSQKKAIEQLMPRWGIKYKMQELNFDKIFARQAPIILEIGFGMGDASAQIAAKHPENNYLGIEVYSSGVGNMLKLIEEHKLNNFRIIQHDAVGVLDHMIGDSTLDGIHIFFPDPWQKTRHHKRRLIQAQFAEQLAKKLKTNAYLHCATDWENYAEHILQVLGSVAELQNSSESYSACPNYRPLTKFEIRGLRLGHGVWDIIFRKKSCN